MANEFIARNGLIAQSDSTISGSLNISGSITSIGTLTAQTLVVQTITSSIDYVTGSSRFGSLPANTHLFTGSVNMTGSLNVIGGITGSFQGTVTTASYALNAVSASYASTASYVLNAISSSYAAITSANVTTALGYTPYNATNPNGYTTNTGTVTGVTGTAPVVSSGGTAPAISMAAASSGVNGYMTGVYATKLDGIATGATANTGTVTGVTGTAPVVSSGGTAPAISMAAASSGVNGYMTGVYATKLDGIAAGATNVTNNNQLTNGAGYITSAGTATSLSGGGGSSIQRTAAGTSYSTMYQMREASGYSGNTAIAGAPALGFHWGGVVASSILMESSGRISIRDNPGTGYEAFIASTIYANSSFQGNLTGNVTGNVSGTAGSISGYGNPTTSATGNTIVYRDANGYITNSYFYASGGGAERNASGMGYFAGHNTGDYYYRSYTAAAAASLLSGQSMNIAGNATTATTATNFNNGNAYSSAGVVYVDTLESVSPTDWLELTYYGGLGVRIGTGVNGSKALYAGSLYDSGNRVYSAANPQVNISGNASTAGSASTAGNITAYTINQNLGTGNSPTFADVTAGLFYGAAYSASLYANNGTTYTQWRYAGSKNGYGGFSCGYSNVNSAMYDSSGNGGVYKEGSGLWYWYFNLGNACMGVNGSANSISYGLYVTKGIYSTADIVAYSDVRKKTNIVTIDNALEKVMKLRGVFYNRIDDEKECRKTGVIAQEINEILPEVVTYAADVDEYGVSYGNIVGVLIEGMKEQQIQIEELKTIINGLTK